MPEISRFYDIIVRMNFSDNERHHKPHVHVECGEFEASVAIDGTLLAGQLPVKQLNRLRVWMDIHEEELYAGWNNAVRQLPINKIDPLR